MSSSEFTRWAAYARREPFGSAVADWHHARTQAVIVNAMKTVLYAFGRTKQRRPVKPTEFMYQRDKKSDDDKLQQLNAGLSMMETKRSKR